MPRPRFARASAELRDNILEAAALELAAHGYDAASLNRILLAAGLSKGAFYYYFDDKADLAATVIERELAQFDFGDLREVHSAAELWAEVERYTQQSLEQLRRSPHGADVISRIGAALARNPDLLARCGPLIAKVQHQIAGFWTRGQALGAVRADLPAHVLMAVIQGCKTALFAAQFPNDRAPTSEELETFTKLHLDFVKRLVKPGGSS